MALATANFTVNFDITTKTINITDTINYAGGGVALTDAVGVLSITDPSATNFYNNTDYNAPDITPNVSLVNSTTINIPEPTTNEFLLGIYSITYTVRVDNGSDPVYYVEVTKTVDFNYCSPEINITQTTNCVVPLFTSTDNTQYIVNGITPTSTTVHSLFFPQGSPLYLSPIVSSSAVISTQVFFTGAQTSVIQSTLSYACSAYFTITDVIQGQLTVVVDCDGVCSVYCCMKSLEIRRTNAQGTNKVLFDKYTETLNVCMSLMSLAKFSLECGRQQDAQGYLDKIKILADCNDDCGCGNDGTPTQVVGLTTTGDSALPWVYVTIANDNAVIVPHGNITINSITSATLKYKKVGTTVTVQIFAFLSVTRSSTNSVWFDILVPSVIAPVNKNSGSAFLINSTANPDIEVPLSLIFNTSAGGRSSMMDTTVMPVATNSYFFQAAITYETTN